MRITDITVIVPLYNKGGSIVSCLKSIREQTYQSYDVIIVDDGSADGSAEFVKNFIAENEDDRFHYLYQENAGVSVARNKGIYYAKSQYVAFLDADDEWDKNFLEEMHSLINSYPCASMYSAFHRIKDHEGNLFSPIIKVPKNYRGCISDYSKVAVSSPLVNSSKVVVRKVDLLEIGCFPEKAVLTEDLFVWFKLSLLNGLCFLNKPLVTINQFPDLSRGARENRTPYIIDYYKLNFGEYCSLSSSQKSYLFSVYLKHLLGSLANANYLEAFKRYLAGLSVFTFKAYPIVILFVLPLPFFGFARRLRRRILSDLNER